MSSLIKRGAAFLSGVLLASAACAQTFPNKPVTLLVPYPAGGLSDVIARTVNAPLGKALGQPVIVENLGGASGGIAAQKVLNAQSDGYMLFQGSPNELILAPLALSSVKYKSEDFRQIHRIALAPMAIIARGDIPANNADELVAYAMKVAKEGKPMTYASVGVGSLYHLLGEQMSKMIGVPMLHIPYKGFADGLKDLMGNQVDIFITPYGAPQVALAKDKKIKFIAATSPGAHPLLPQLGRTSDSKSALKNFISEIGTGYFVKRDTPEPIVQAMHKGLQAVLGDAEYLSRMAALGQLASPLQTLDVANKAFVDETTQYRAIAKAINLQAQ